MIDFQVMGKRSYERVPHDESMTHARDWGLPHDESAAHERLPRDVPEIV